MGAKKKGGGKKKAAAADEVEDVSVHQFFKAYKAKTKELGVDLQKYIKEKYDLYCEEDEKIEKFNLWEELGWAGTRAIMDSLRHVNYPHCKSIRFWKTYCEDEGVRAICQFIELGKGTLFLELLDNKITSLGCEFIARALHPRVNPTIQILKLDHNEFGAAGVNQLSEALAINPVLRVLSLTYCGIDHTAAQALFEILIYTRSALEEVNLSGNSLGNEGTCRVLMGTAIAKSLKKIYLADN